MIRFFIFALLALVAGSVLYALLGDDPGYLLISFGTWSIETSLLLAIIALVLLGFAAWVLYHLLGLLLPWRWFRGQVRHSSEARADAASLEGLRMLAHGNLKEAYKTLLESARHCRSPLLNYLGACLAAYQAGDQAGVRFSLSEAEKIGGGGTLSVGIIKAHIAIADKHLEQALAILLDLNRQYPQNLSVLLILKNVLQQLGDWEKLALVLPALEKTQALDQEELSALRVQVAESRLRDFRQRRGAEAKDLEAIWEAVPDANRKDENLLAQYVRNLIALGEDDRAQIMLIRYFKHDWSDTLVKMIGYLETRDANQQLVLLEKLMQDRPGNPVLALTLGRVSLRNKLWGKGKEYFEAALVFSHDEKLSAEINAELARLLEHMGEPERSAACYKKAMALLDYELPDLPYPGLT